MTHLASSTSSDPTTDGESPFPTIGMLGPSELFGMLFGGGWSFELSVCSFCNAKSLTFERINNN